MISRGAGEVAEVVGSEIVVLLTGAADCCRLTCLAPLRTLLTLLNECVKVSLYAKAPRNIAVQASEGSRKALSAGSIAIAPVALNWTSLTSEGGLILEISTRTCPEAHPTWIEKITKDT